RGCAANGIAYGGIDCPIEICALRTEWVIAGQPQLLTVLPPSMLADDHARIEPVVQPGPRAHAPGRCLHGYPATGHDPTRRRRLGVQLDLRMRRTLAQAGHGTMLGLAQQGGLCA